MNDVKSHTKNIFDKMVSIPNYLHMIWPHMHTHVQDIDLIENWLMLSLFLGGVGVYYYFFLFIQFFKNVGQLLPFLHVACIFCVVCLLRLWSFPFVGFLLHMPCGNTFWVGIRVRESKVHWMDKVICLL